MDRFIVGAVLPVAMVGFYTAPFEAVTKLWMIPTSLTATVFPACSVLGQDRKKELELLYCRSIKYLLLVLAPVTLVLCLFAQQIMQVWLGVDFAAKSTPVLQILSVGVFINCFAHIPFCFIQGLGRPDVTARLFAAELLPYAAIVWLMVHHGGIVGAATAWSIRAAIEVLLLMLIAWRLYSLSPHSVLGVGTARSVLALVALGIAMMGTKMAFGSSLRAEIIVSTLWLLVFAIGTWKYVFDDSDRISILSLIDPFRNAARNQRAIS
jgi:O-antigen/teichoic acid export membrane protein